MIEIDEEITPDNYHLIFSAAEALRTYSAEIIHVTKDIRLMNAHIDYLPDYLEVDCMIDLENSTLEKLPEHLTVHFSMYLMGTKITHIPETFVMDRKDRAHINNYIHVSNKQQFIRDNPKYADVIESWRC